MSVDQTLHVEGASALLGQLTEHLRLQENKILQVHVTRHLLCAKSERACVHQQAKVLWSDLV